MMSLRVALRTLTKTPFVTGIAVLSLALGIGATAAIFSLFDQAIMRPLPVPGAERLVNLSAPGPKPGSSSCNSAGPCADAFSYPMFRDLERMQTVFTGIAAHRLFQANLAFGGQTLSGQGLFVSGSYFPVLELSAASGRLIEPGDDRTIGESPVVVLSHAYWQERFAADPNAIGRTMIVNGQTMTVVGVAPKGFSGTTAGSAPQIFVPITMRQLLEPFFGNWAADRRAYWAYLFARLKPGITLEQSRAALQTQYSGIINQVEVALQQNTSPQTLERFRARQVGIEPGPHGQSQVSTTARTPLLLLFAVTGLVLAIACGNIANLLLARAMARTGEIAIRLSLGASRWQLVGQLLTESCLLALLGGLAGLVVSHWTLQSIGAMLPPEAQITLQLALDRRVLAFAAMCTLGTGLLFGLFPALHSTRPDLLPALKGQAGQPGGGPTVMRFRTSLVTAQIALSMALLVCAGLFIKSLSNVGRTALGLDVDHIATFHVSPELSGYKVERSLAFDERLEDELRAIPGVTDATANLIGLMAGDAWGQGVRVQDFAAGPDTDSNSNINEIGPGYFRALGVPILAGREFTPADAGDSPKVAVVSQAFARKFNLGSNPIGKRIGFRGFNGVLDTEIVGLVPDMKYSDVKEPPSPVAFRPYRQNKTTGSLNFYVRTPMAPERLFPAIRQALARLDPALPVENLVTLPQRVRDNVFLDRLVTLLSVAFAVLATLLAAVGLYGVLAYTVAQRTREIGLRMALGADPSRVRRMVLAQLGRMLVAGTLAGLAAAFSLGRAAESILFGLKGSDPVVLAGSTFVLAIVAIAAGWIPAFRASRVEPMQALRYE